MNAFLALHFPLLFVMLYGMALLARNDRGGLIFSLSLSLGGIFAFAIHTYFTAKGRPEFRTVTSISILAAILVISVIQLVATFKML